MRAELDARLKDVLSFLALVVFLLIAWQATHVVAGETALASPWLTIVRTYELLGSSRFWEHFATTTWTFFIASVISIVGGILIGLVIGSSPLLTEAGEPVLIALYTVPKVAFFPVILLVFGIGLPAQVVYAFLHGIIPVAIFTITSIRNVRPVFRKTSRVMGLSTGQYWWHVVIPSAIPEVFSGIRLGISLTFIGTILAEMFGSKSGLGYRLMQAIGINDGALILALTLIIVILAMAFSWVLLAIDNRLHKRV
ncbi:ABC transporter permease [Allomesorhizobium alhagi]|uniref:ABC transporter n=1 Tax=Mesorhizobium alhagi CCNWXJ12-2 TaxID=1107882 RepID=H0HWX0_9HYPH|nr:ABC transporter permease [Mesorhizobium alhagi]EHK54773.1 ABC transporter [Mesorhizobium alhagi CCNWXJ12-2]